MTLKNGKPRYRESDAYVKNVSKYIATLRDPGRVILLTEQQKKIMPYMARQCTNREVECMALYYVDGLNHKQISDYLHINVATVSRNIRRGIGKIEDVLSFVRTITGDGLY